MHPTNRLRVGILVVAAALIAADFVTQGPIAQALAYHQFADQRSLLGVPNFWNVVSNAPFTLVGAAGLWLLLGQGPPGALPRLRPAYLIFFGGVALVGFGSAYYHWAPDNDTLVWDRLPMTVAFMGFFCAVVGERIDERLALRALGPLIVAGLASVLYWQATERSGHGDLRPYLLVQFLPLGLMPLILLLYPSRLSGTGYLWAVIAVYVVAKVCEEADRAIFGAGEVLSGHTLKHLTAALGPYLFLVALRRRRAGVAGAHAADQSPAQIEPG